jgi:hypothetical protein
LQPALLREGFHGVGRLLQLVLVRLLCGRRIARKVGGGPNSFQGLHASRQRVKQTSEVQ